MPLPAAGALTKSADLTAIFPQGVDGWTAFTPLWTQGPTITCTNGSRYMRIGRTVVAQIYLGATSAGTAANSLVVTLPVNAASGIGASIGSFRFTDAGSAFYSGTVVVNAVGNVVFQNGGSSTGNLGATGGGFTLAVASGDSLTALLVYEAA